MNHGGVPPFATGGPAAGIAQSPKLMHILNKKLFDAIASAVDLDDPAEQSLAQRFMIEAIGRVTAQLPEVARSAAAVANRYITGAATAEEVIAERVRLWRAIEGRDQSDEPDVLKIRTAICVLHPMDSGATAETLEYFFEFWRQAGLAQAELEAAARNRYGI
ncbi:MULTISPECIES: hypothetical protein [unclassified Janthinobacterium]|nr:MULTISPECIES: hypothetical protein [unclassified Janthinobacterium]